MEEVVNSECEKIVTLVSSVNANEPKWYEIFSKFSKMVIILERIH